LDKVVFALTITPMERVQFNTNEFKSKPDPMSQDLDKLGKLIVDAAYTVHKRLGPGLLEKVYEICLCHELVKRGLSYQRQVDIPIVYDNIVFREGLRLDVLVEDLVICELKAIEIVNPVWEAQLLSHLKLTNRRLGYLINFNVPNIGKGIRRFAN
jgi:GxxExxY protein